MLFQNPNDLFFPETASLHRLSPICWTDPTQKWRSFRGSGQHIRTTNPIESTFASVRHRTGKTKGCLSHKTGLAMAFKLMLSAQGKWQKLNGANRMPEIIQDIAFVDGIKQNQTAA